MAVIVYILSTTTCCFCAFLLFRQYLRSQVRLLMWIALCFAGLTVNNLLLIIDFLLGADADLSMLRLVVADLSIASLALGLAWDSR